VAAAGEAAQRVIAVLPELYAVTPSQEFPARVLAVASRLIGCDKGDYTEVDLATGAFRVLVSPEPSALRQLSEARRAHTHQHPSLRHFVRVDDPRALQISDFLRPAEFHRLGIYGEFFKILGVEAQLTIAFRTPAAMGTGVSLDRGPTGFSDQDRLMFDLLRPHIVIAQANAAHFSQALARHDHHEQPATPVLERLTDRQLQVLALVADGATNAAIADQLTLSVGTVRKHLEHILRRLQVSSRTAAATHYATHEHRPPPQARWTATLDKIGS